MKRFAIILAFVAALAGCSAAQQQNLATLAANAKTQVQNACAVVQPTLLDLSASIPLDPNLALLAKDNGQLCAAVATLDPTSAKSLIETLIPQAINLVGLLPVDPATQMTIRLALGAASLALSNWLMIYGQPATTAAAAPVAASQ